MRYRATRSLHYVTADGQDRIVNEGDFVTKAAAGKLEALLADGLVVEVKKPAPAQDEEE